MRGLIFLAPLILLSCSTYRQERTLASLEDGLDIFDPVKSVIQIHYPNRLPKEAAPYLYLRVKNSNGRFIHLNCAEVSLKTSKGLGLPFEWLELDQGHYYITFKNDQKVEVENLRVFVQGQLLSGKILPKKELPDPVNTKIDLYKKELNAIWLRMRIRDNKNRPILLDDPPELILDGYGRIGKIQQLSGGDWEFEVILPPEDQIIYLSVRIMGQHFKNILRHQHLEKDFGP
jgi:hypothetical protein